MRRLLLSLALFFFDFLLYHKSSWPHQRKGTLPNGLSILEIFVIATTEDVSHCSCGGKGCCLERHCIPKELSLLFLFVSVNRTASAAERPQLASASARKAEDGNDNDSI